jgi:hypothetical protein
LVVAFGNASAPALTQLICAARARIFATLRMSLPRTLLLLLVCCVSRQALAQADAQPSAPSAEYESALDQALDAHARGDFDTARGFMERAHQLRPSARTLRGLGTIAMAQERFAEAIAYLEQALASDALPLTDELRAGVEKLLRHAFEHVGAYTFVTTPRDAKLSADGGAALVSRQGAVLLAPGQHLLRIESSGYVTQDVPLQAAAGETRVLEVVLIAQAVPSVAEPSASTPAATPAVTPAAAAVQPTRAATDAPAASTPWLALGAGAALLVGGAVTWTIGYLKLQDIDEQCRDQTPSGCTPAQAERLYDDRGIGTFAVSSIVLAGTGAVTLITVGVLELSAGKPAPAAELGVAPGSVQLRGRF